MTIVTQYIQYRQDCKHEKLLRLLADDIVLTSTRDGTFTGKQEFENYLQQVPPSGTWDPPRKADGNYIVDGTVPLFFMNWPVEAIFTVNDKGLINKIDVHRK